MLSSVSMVREGLSGDFLAFNVRFDDNNTGGLYVASPPELLDGIGQTYVQNFDAALGNDSNVTGTILPTGWFMTNDGNPSFTITTEFPPGNVAPGTYNAGVDSAADRALVIGNAGSD